MNKCSCLGAEDKVVNAKHEQNILFDTARKEFTTEELNYKKRNFGKNWVELEIKVVEATFKLIQKNQS